MKKTLFIFVLSLLIFSKSSFAEIKNEVVTRTIWQLKKLLNDHQLKAKSLKEKNHYRRLSLNLLYIERLLRDYYRTCYLLDKIYNSNEKKTLLINSQAFDNFGRVRKGYENKKYVKIKGNPIFAKRGPRYGLGTTYDGKPVKGLAGCGWKDAIGWQHIK